MKRAARARKAAWPELEVDPLAWILPRSSSVANSAKGTRSRQGREVQHSSRRVQLVPVNLEKERTVNATKDDARAKTTRRLRGKDCKLPFLRN